MHDTAAAFGAAFFRCYADTIEGVDVLEVGSGDVNGALRGCAPIGSRYTGIDISSGSGVDVILNDPYHYPFEAASFDIVVSSSCLEHDSMFWLSFIEMCRVARPGGFIYLNVPSNGKFHRHPTDNWRFYPDAGLALAAWGRRKGHDVRLVESFIGRRRRDMWNDCVMIFAKGKAPRPLRLLAELFPRSFNIRVGEEDAIANYIEPTEDMALRAWMAEKLSDPSNSDGDDQQASIEVLITALAEREVALGAAERSMGEHSAAVEAQIAALRKEIEERNDALARTEAELAVQVSSMRVLEAEITLLRGERKNLQKSLASLSAQLDQAKSEVAKQQQSIEHLRDELAAARSDLVTRDQALDDAVRIADALAVDLRTAQAELAAGDTALMEAERTATEIRAERDQTLDERDRLARESSRWFEAAILAPAQDVTRPRMTSKRLIWRRYGGSHEPAHLSLTARADRARDERHWELAARFYLDALRRRPDRTAIWVQLGHALKEAGKISEAEFAYRRAINLDADNFDALLPLGEVLNRLDRKGEAITALARALALAPSDHQRQTISNELTALGWQG